MLSKQIPGLIRKNWLNLIFWGLLLLVLFSAGAKSWVLKQFVSMGVFNARIQPVPSGEKFAFTFIGPGSRTVTADSLKGKVVFINFWASWCPPCRAEMASIHSLYQKLNGDKRFVFILVNEDDDRTKGSDYLERNQFPMPIYYREGMLPAHIFSGTLPTTIIMNKDGAIVYRHEGIGGYDGDAFIQQMKALL